MALEYLTDQGKGVVPMDIAIIVPGKTGGDMAQYQLKGGHAMKTRPE
jgi:hypothetical protein